MRQRHSWWAQGPGDQGQPGEVSPGPLAPHPLWLQIRVAELSQGLQTLVWAWAWFY